MKNMHNFQLTKNELEGQENRKGQKLH